MGSRAMRRPSGGCVLLLRAHDVSLWHVNWVSSAFTHMHAFPELCLRFCVSQNLSEECEELIAATRDGNN